MSSKVLVILVSLSVISLALPEKRFMAEGCDRPLAFKYPEDVEKYIKCIKGLSDHRYGKRSQPSPSILIRHLLPSPYADYGSQPSQDLQELYKMLKYDDK